jgi:hypothetical protein
MANPALLVAARVAAARDRAAQRYASLSASQIACNAQADGELLGQAIKLDPAAQELLSQAVSKFRLSGAAITAWCGWRPPLPIWPPRTASPKPMLPKRCNTAAPS